MRECVCVHGHVRDTCIQPIPAVAAGQADQVYVKRWLRTKHAILFRLSNRAVQVNAVGAFVVVYERTLVFPVSLT